MAAEGDHQGRSSAVRGLLTEIELQRELRDGAYDSAENPKAAWLLSGALGEHAQGVQAGLEALVLQALGAPEPPTDEDIAEASGFPLEYLHELKVRLGLVEGEAPEGPARRRRWFRR